MNGPIRNTKVKTAIKRIALVFSALLILTVLFTLYANIRVDRSSSGRIYTVHDSVPYNKVALLLGTNPLNRWGGPNSYFTNRINTAAALYHAGKVDFIIASGDNHTKEYDEPSAMRDSLIAHGVPEHRIILDYAGFRTLDSVVRSKEVFGCESITVVSQADHNARALYLAEANNIDAIAVSSPVRAGRWVRLRLTLREWLARDKMMLDILFGKRPHFLGKKIEIPDITPQKSYSTADGMTIKIAEPLLITSPVDSLVLQIHNDIKEEIMTGQYYSIEKLEENGEWRELPHIGGCIFTAEGWIIAPEGTTNTTINPNNYVNTKHYDRNWKPGTYRLSKPFTLFSHPHENTDTAFVEFKIR
ncbi:MAG: YdcF family protein [Muribaculaceae bacterium]|nr:YdcF family protein [Muribaculaceae bacterium]